MVNTTALFAMPGSAHQPTPRPDRAQAPAHHSGQQAAAAAAAEFL